MTLDTVRARRHYLALNRIADERMRRGRSKPVTPRAPSSTTLVIRESDDDASGSPATITRLVANITEDNYFNIDAQKRIGVFIEKIVHKSGPVLVAPAFGPDDLGRDGSIVIKSVGKDDQPYGTEDPEEPETPDPADPATPPTTPTLSTTGGSTP